MSLWDPKVISVQLASSHPSRLLSFPSALFSRLYRGEVNCLTIFLAFVESSHRVLTVARALGFLT